MADAFAVLHLRESTWHQQMFKCKRNMGNYRPKTEAPKGKRFVQGHTLASGDVLGRESKSVSPIRCSFHQIIILHCAPRVPGLSIGRERRAEGRPEREGESRIEQGSHPLPIHSRKLAIQPGNWGREGLPGSQRSPVRDPEASGAVSGHRHKGPRRIEAAHQAPHVQLVARERAAQSIPGGAARHGPSWYGAQGLRSARSVRRGGRAAAVEGLQVRSGGRPEEPESRCGKGGREGARRKGRVTQQP